MSAGLLRKLVRRASIWKDCTLLGGMLPSSVFGFGEFAALEDKSVCHTSFEDAMLSLLVPPHDEVAQTRRTMTMTTYAIYQKCAGGFL